MTLQLLSPCRSSDGPEKGVQEREGGGVNRFRWVLGCRDLGFCFRVEGLEYHLFRALGVVVSGGLCRGSRNPSI